MGEIKDKLHIFYVYLLVSGVFFTLGLIGGYVLPNGSFVYNNLEESLINNLRSNGTFALTALADSFGEELFYLIFAVTACFTVRRHQLYCCLTAYKGCVSGLCNAILMRCLKSGAAEARFEILGCIIFSLLTAASCCLICLLCTESAVYAKRVILPPKLKYLLKRKDTYIYLRNVLALCGAVLVIILLKHGDIVLMAL